jgi:hypothetical protein
VSTDIFGDLVNQVQTMKLEPLASQEVSTTPAVLSPPNRPVSKPESVSDHLRSVSPAGQPVSPPPRPSTRQQHAHRSTGTFGQDIDIPIYDNEICEPDPSWPRPVYPRTTGETHPEDPLPNIAVAPRKYYYITKGLRLGVYYETWRVPYTLERLHRLMCTFQDERGTSLQKFEGGQGIL